MDPNGSRSRGKKSKRAQARWDAVAEAVYDLMVMDEYPEVEDFKDINDDEKVAAYQIAGALISLADNLLGPALRKGLEVKKK